MKTVLKWAALFGLPVLMLTLLGVPAAHALTSAGSVHPQVLFAGITLGANVPTLLDWAKRINPDGRIAQIAELLTQRNEVLDDMIVKEGNLPVGDRITQRVGLPTVYFRLLNQGVPKSKSLTTQVDEQCAIIEGRSEIDIDLANLNGDVNAFRLSEAMPFIEAMNQQFVSTLFYGNSGLTPEQFTGLSLRYSATAAVNGKNIIKSTGAGADNMSIWLVGWGENSVYGIAPKGSQAGLVHQDLGEGDAFDGSNNRFRAYMERFQWKVGIAVKDWRYIVRIANISQAALVADPTAATVTLTTYMAKAIDRIPNPGNARLVFYCNRTVKSMLRVQAMNKSVAQLGFEPAINQFGNTIHQLVFLGIPVKTVDQLLETEATIT